jgi:hypothetical protein
MRVLLLTTAAICTLTRAADAAMVIVGSPEKKLQVTDEATRNILNSAERIKGSEET